MKQPGSCKLLYLLECFLVMMKNSLLLRLFSSPRAWFSRDAGEPVWFPHVPMVLARMLAQSEESHGQELVNQSSLSQVPEASRAFRGPELWEFGFTR